MYHLLLNRTTDEVIIVTHDSYVHVFATDNEYVEIEYHSQLQANGITVPRLLKAVEAFVNNGVQKELFISQDEALTQRDVKTQIIRRGVNE